MVADDAHPHQPRPLLEYTRATAPKDEAMKCRHGVTGRCVECGAEIARGELLVELARLVAQIADSHGFDTSRIEDLMRRLR